MFYDVITTSTQKRTVDTQCNVQLMSTHVFPNKEKHGKMSQTTILKTGVPKPMTFLDVEDFNRKLRIIINAAETSTTRSLMISDETFLTAIKGHLTFPLHVWRDNETNNHTFNVPIYQ